VIKLFNFTHGHAIFIAILSNENFRLTRIKSGHLFPFNIMDEWFMVVLYNTLNGYLIVRDRRTIDEVKDFEMCID